MFGVVCRVVFVKSVSPKGRERKDGGRALVMQSMGWMVYHAFGLELLCT